jgi:hypothetical protein
MGALLWIHSVCERCWSDEMAKVVPFKIGGHELDVCCKCQKVHESGIYVKRKASLKDCGCKKGVRICV